MRFDMLQGAASLALISVSAQGAVLFDQIGSPANLPATGPEGFYRYGSQVFVGEPQYDLAALDDFSLSSAARIDSVATVIAGYGAFSSFGAIQGFELRLFASPQDAAAGFGNALASASLGVPSVYESFGTGMVVQFALAQPIDILAGHYWMTVQAVNHAPSNGQVGVVISDIGDWSSFQANPGGGFGVPGNLIARPVNLAYRLGGTLVPTPGSVVALLALGLAGRRARASRGRSSL
jgi:hypothetical protein